MTVNELRAALDKLVAERPETGDLPVWRPEDGHAIEVEIDGDFSVSEAQEWYGRDLPRRVVID